LSVSQNLLILLFVFCLDYGAFAIVYKGRYKNKEVAVKKLNITKTDEDLKIYAIFRKELEIISYFKIIK
jgi:hypothetical protein